MSSPNHSTSDIEDAFSSMNILNYTSVSSDYFPVSLGSNSFNSLENSNDNMIPPVFSSFYNNTYLKDVQAIYAKELPISSPDPITPPAILTLFPVLPPSLLFNPRYFFIPEELLLPRKQIHSPSSSSTTLFNSSRNQTCNLHHEEQIEDILNYLEELSFHRIEKMEEGRINEENKVTFATGTLTNDALSWWNAYAQPIGIEQANQTTWTKLKRLLTNKYCPRTEIRKMEEELYNLSVKRNDLKPYVRRFQELTTLCPNMVPNNEKLLEAFIGGLPRSIDELLPTEPRNFGGSHQHIPEVNGSDNKTRFYARNQ
ncbi:reverse transcriptase domain-containing protein [Tanacetum coccineum]